MKTQISTSATTHVPNIPVETAHEPTCVPVIDIGCLHQQPTTRSLIVGDIKRACQKLGCFQVINHGIDKAVIMGALEAASEFFLLSNEEKAEFASDDVTKPVRYIQGTAEKPRAFLKHYAHPLNEWIHFWPLDPPDYREKMGKYVVEVKRVAMQLMDAILEGLGLGHAYLSEKLEKGMQVMAVNGYQESSDPTRSQLGFAPHSDYGCLTLLIQTCQGLQIMERDTDTWRAVPVVPEALYVHIGDYLEVLSNGQYKSTLHRALVENQKRVSIASIHSLSMDEMVVTPNELIDEQHPKVYRDSNFRGFLDFISNNDVTSGGSFIDSLRIIGA